MSILDVKDRLPTNVLSNKAVRYGVYDEEGKLLRYEYIKREDEPTEEGSPINKKLFDIIDDNGMGYNVGKEYAVEELPAKGVDYNPETYRNQFITEELLYPSTRRLRNGNLLLSYYRQKSAKASYYIHTQAGTAIGNTTLLSPCSDIDGCDFENENIMFAFYNTGSKCGECRIFTPGGSAVTNGKLFTSSSDGTISEINCIPLDNNTNMIIYKKGVDQTLNYVIFDSEHNQVVTQTQLYSDNPVLYANATKLKNGNIMIAITENTDTRDGKILVINQDGDKIGTVKTFYENGVTMNSITALENGNAVIAFVTTVTGLGNYVIVDENGDIVKNATIFNNDTTDYPSTASFPDGNFLISFQKVNQNKMGFVSVYSENGDIIKSSYTYQVDTDETLYPTAGTTQNGIALIFYGDAGATKYGCYARITTANNTVRYAKKYNLPSIGTPKLGQKFNIWTLEEDFAIKLDGADKVNYFTSSRFGNGDVLFAFATANSTTANNRGSYKIFSKNGRIPKESTWGSATSDNIKSCTTPNGNVITVYVQKLSSSSPLQMNLFKQDGTLIQQKTIVSGTFYNPNIVPLANGNFFVTYYTSSYRNSVVITESGDIVRPPIQHGSVQYTYQNILVRTKSNKVVHMFYYSSNMRVDIFDEEGNIITNGKTVSLGIDAKAGVALDTGNIMYLDGGSNNFRYTIINDEGTIVKSVTTIDKPDTVPSDYSFYYPDILDLENGNIMFLFNYTSGLATAIVDTEGNLLKNATIVDNHSASSVYIAPTLSLWGDNKEKVIVFRPLAYGIKVKIINKDGTAVPEYNFSENTINGIPVDTVLGVNRFYELVNYEDILIAKEVRE